MLTIKIPYMSDKSEEIRKLQEDYSPVIRSSYVRAMSGWKEVDIRSYCRDMYPDRDSWFLQSCVKEGMTHAATDIATKRTKRIFGGKKNFHLRAEGKISNTEWKNLRVQPLPVIGEAGKCGNRKFEFKIIDSNQIIFKACKKNHIILTLPKLRKVLKRTLEKLELASNDSILPITFKITDTHICITYDETKLNGIKNYHPVQNRVAGIDMNPNFIGFSIPALHDEMFKLNQLTICSRQKSSHEKSIYVNDKLQHETIEVAKVIVSRLVHFKVETLVLEDLSFNQGDKGLGSNFNRLTQNKWKRGLFTKQLIKRCKAEGIAIKIVNPAYSSFIGNCMYEFPDPISAANEIARRGTKNEPFYPPVEVKESLANQWKKELGENLSFDDWKILWQAIKNSKVKYRVPIPIDGFQIFSSIASQITCLTC